MSSFQGIGSIYYGRKNFNPADKSFITIKWFILFLLPIIPLKAYRIIRGDTKAGFNGLLSASTSYSIVGEVPLMQNLDLVLFTYLKVYLGIVFLFMGFENPIWFIIPIGLIIKFFVDEHKNK